MLDSTQTEFSTNPQDIKITDSTQSQAARIVIHKIYNKGQQFIIDGFTDDLTKNWNPQITLQANPRIQLLESGQYEVILTIHIKAQQIDKMLFQIQLEQAGLFTLQQVAEEQKELVLYGACSNALFPYAAVMVNQILSQAGLPHIYLNPLDFVTLYQQHQAKPNKI
ncbi:MAG: protein-export chaperone SecB [Legionella sp.]|nr:protein-export chaperone SecB [Legionella sp.]